MASSKLHVLLTGLLISFLCLIPSQSKAQDSKDKSSNQPIQMLPFHRVDMNDLIWKPRIEKLMNNTLPHAFKNTEVAQERLRLCAEYLENGGGEKPAPHRFNTSDLYKVMEGAALMLKTVPNPTIEADMDRIIDIIARAQKEDGYLYVPHITGSITESSMGSKPYSYVVHSHELYNIGHLYEAAVAYAQSTGKTKLLDVAEKSAQHVNKAFFIGDPNYNNGKPVNQAPGHEEIELGLIKLYRYTGNNLYLDMAKRFLDIRGVTFVPNGTGVNSPTYAQNHKPVAQQTKAVGHAVRATYLYSAMAEVDGILESDDYSRALQSIWHDIVDSKMHISGGLGAMHGIEGFGPSYILPNKDAYLETCAAVGNVFFNIRLFLKNKHAKYLDVAEIALLNNCLSGIGLDGTSFFYPNPMEAEKHHKPRSGWFGTACCPSNISRLIPQVSGYLYATEGNEVYAALFGSSTAEIEIPAGKMKITQNTKYPYSGDIYYTIHPEKSMHFKMLFRIPTWTGKQMVPGDLYRYTETSPKWQIRLNNKIIYPDVENGFAIIERNWQKGDRVLLSFPMPVKINTCNEKVEANKDRILFSKGPLVYCAEGIDNEGSVQRFFIPDMPESHQYKTDVFTNGILEGLPSVEFPVQQLEISGETREYMLKMIPYFAWSNRDRSSMITWLPTRKELAEKDKYHPDMLKFKSIKASWSNPGDPIENLRIMESPASSNDHSIGRWTSYQQQGVDQWIEITLKNKQEVQSVAVYWFDDSRGVQLPASWHIQYQDKGQWKKLEIYNTDSYSILPNDYNTVHPAEILITDKLRICISPKKTSTVGVLGLEIETK